MSYRHEYEDVRKFNTQYSKTGEKVQLIRRYCKCGHSLNFIKRRPATCTYCGRLVYPDDKFEFVEKMKKELKNEICA